MHSFFKKRFVVITGKGGVGRTTLSLIISSLAAERNLRTLSCLPFGHRTFSWLSSDLTPGAVNRVGTHLDILHVSPVVAREEYGLQILKSRALQHLVFSSRHVNSFLDAVPGLAEWAILGKASYHALRPRSDPDQYDMVLLDAPATGHGLDMLRLPSAIESAVSVGRIRDEALERCVLLRDAERSAVIPVTILEELPVNETIELVTALRKDGFSVPFLIVNRVFQEEDDPLESLAGLTPGCSVPGWARAAVVHRSRAQRQRLLLETITSRLSLPIISMRERSGEVLSPHDFQSMMDEFSTGLNAV